MNEIIIKTIFFLARFVKDTYRNNEKIHLLTLNPSGTQ